jgi:flagellar motor switch protein FliM
VQIGGKDRFVGRPGISNGKVAVRITGSTDHSGEESNAS